MKRVFTAISVAALGFCLFATSSKPQSVKRGYEVDPSSRNAKAEVNVNEIDAVGLTRAKKLKPISVEFNADPEAIPLSLLPKGAYLKDFHFDERGNIYLMSCFPQKREASLARIASEGGKYEQIDLPDGIEGLLVEFTIDNSGKIYGALHKPGERKGAIIILTSNGDLVSKIDTRSFLPTQLAVDSQGKIWVSGELFDGYGTESLYLDTQVRVYETSGDLVSIPIGGLKAEDAGLSVFLTGEQATEFVSSSDNRVYSFVESKLAQASLYPFQPVETGDFTSQAKLAKSPRLVKGSFPFNDLAVWYGSIEDDRGTGTYGKNFIALATLKGEPVTPEIIVPAEYGPVVGADRKGNLYTLQKNGEGVFLKRLRIGIAQKERL